MATDAERHPLRHGWHDAGTVTVTGTSVSGVTIHPGSLGDLTEACLRQQTSATGYDDAGNATATIDAKGERHGSSTTTRTATTPPHTKGRARH